MGKINFVRRFVPDFSQIVKPLQQMVKQSIQFKWNDIEKVSFKNIKVEIDHEPYLRSPDFVQIVKPLQQMVTQSVKFKWTDVEKVSFNDIKATIAHVPSLKIPNSEKDFILYTISLDNSLIAVLTQREEMGDEYPISFMSTGLQGVELNYPSIDKYAYAVFKAVKQFKPYILKNRTKVIVPHLGVKSPFVQNKWAERRGNWVTALQEYDLEFKAATIIKGQGISKLIKEDHNDDNDWAQ